MEFRKFEITLISADNLPDIRLLGLMKVYAEVSIKGEPKTAKKTPLDLEGETNPKWNFPMEYTIGEAAVRQQGITLGIILYCSRTFKSDKYIGEVNLPLKDLFDDGISAQNVSHVVAGTPRGRLNISYKFGERIFVRKPSAWHRALEFGFMMLLGGAFLLLKGPDDETEVPVFTNSKDAIVDDEDDVFYDASETNS